MTDDLRPIHDPDVPGETRRDPMLHRAPETVVASTLVEEHDTRPRNRVQWGPVFAGTVTALVTLLLLSVLGLAIGASAFEPGVDRSDWGTAAGIWGAISALIALFVGGWVAARAAAVAGGFAGLLNGFLVGAATLLIILWLTTTGVTNLLGFVGNNVADIAAVASETLNLPPDAENQVQDAATSAQETANEVLNDQETFDRVAGGAWGTFIVLLVALAAATFGGLLGRNDTEDLGPTAA
jgi:hypothetical protein